MGGKSQSLLIQRSYSYLEKWWTLSGNNSSRNPFLFRGPIPTERFIKKCLSYYGVAIPSYSEVLFLQMENEKLLTPRESQSLLIQRSYSYLHATISKHHPMWDGRNPFLFRGPIPTKYLVSDDKKYRCRNPFLFRGPIPTLKSDLYSMKKDYMSQSLLIQRSYSYLKWKIITLK